MTWVELSWVDNWPIWTQCTGIGYKCQPELLSRTTEVICISYFWLFAKNVNLSYRSAILTRNSRVLCVSYFNPFSFSSKTTGVPSQNQKWVLKKQNHPPKKTVGKVQNLPIQKNLIVDLWKYVTLNNTRLSDFSKWKSLRGWNPPMPKQELAPNFHESPFVFNSASLNLFVLKFLQRIIFSKIHSSHI